MHASRKTQWWYACALVLVIAIVACRERPAERPWPKLRIGYLPIAAELPLFVAAEEGLLTSEGLTYELVQLPSSNELTNAATAGRVDVLAGSAANVVFDSGEASGKRHDVFAVNPYSDLSGHVTDYLLVRSDSPAKSIADLRGARIASFPGSVVVLVQIGLAKYDLPKDSYQSIQMLPKDWEPSLRAGAVDAVVALEPSATQIMKDGVARPLLAGFYAKLMPEMPLSGHWLSADYLRQADPEQIAAILRAYRKAIELCSSNPAAAKQYLVKYANVRDDVLVDVGLNPWVMASPETPERLQTLANLLFDNGGLNKKVIARSYVLSQLAN
jgi:NitT/TauT family transport system substrate-binding protein